MRVRAWSPAVTMNENRSFDGLVAVAALDGYGNVQQVYPDRPSHRIAIDGARATPGDVRTIQSPFDGQPLRVAGIVRRAAGCDDERFADAVSTRAFLDRMEAAEGDKPLPMAVDLELLRGAGLEHVAALWAEYREMVSAGVLGDPGAAAQTT